MALPTDPSAHQEGSVEQSSEPSPSSSVGSTVAPLKKSGSTAAKFKSTRRSVACKSCHSLKVKCTPADENNPGGPCVRCLSAKRKCEIDLSQTRKRRKKSEMEEVNRNNEGESSMTKQEETIASLQEQVKNLKAQLRQQNNFPSRNMTAGSLLDVNSPPFISKIDVERELNLLCESSTPKLTNLTNTLKSVADRRSFLLKQGEVIDVVSLGLITLREARERLDLYKKVIYVAYPLVEVPEHLTVEDLQKGSPFLLNAIMSATNAVYNNSLNNDQALALDNIAFKSVAVEVMVAGTKSDELIKSLLLLCLWYNSPELFKQRRYHLLNSLSVALLHDLGIVARPSYQFKNNEGAISLNPNQCSNLEYRSLVMIVYFTTVSICLLLRRTVYVKWTPFVEECCTELEKSNDEKWVQLALFSRLNHELEKIHNIVHSPDISYKRNSASQFIIRGLQNSLGLIRAKISDEDRGCLAYYYSVEAYLHEPVLSNIFTKDTEMDESGVKLNEDSVISISNCTTSCLNAIDVFNHMTPQDIATIPLFYASRIVYTVGMLLRLRYLILSLPSHIEKDLVPQHAVFAVQKLIKLVDQASASYSFNNFLKKTRLVLQLFIQTYVTQVQELLKNNGETPQNFKPTSFPKKELSEMDRLCKLFRADHETSKRSIIAESGQAYPPPQVPLDILSYAATYGRDDRKESESKSAPINTPISNQLTDSPSLQPPPLTYSKDDIVTRSNGNIGISSKMSNSILGNIANNINRPSPVYSINTNSLGPMMQNNAIPNFNQNITNNYNGSSLQHNLANAGQLENSYLAVNDEFWADLLSTDSDKINFSNNNSSSQFNDDIFFMK